VESIITQSISTKVPVQFWISNVIHPLRTGGVKHATQRGSVGSKGFIPSLLGMMDSMALFSLIRLQWAMEMISSLPQQDSKKRGLSKIQKMMSGEGTSIPFR